MPVNILMPALSPTMEKGNLAKWLKKEGDTIKAGDILAEIETDKATMEVEAVDEGILAKIVVPDGTNDVPVNQLIGLIASEGEDAKSVSADGGSKPAAPASSPAPASAPATPSVAAANAEAAPTGEMSYARVNEAPDGPAKPAGGAAAPAAKANGAAPATEGRLFASPLARRIAKEAGLDLAGIQGSGPHGRIVQSDVQAAVAGGGAKPAAPSQPAASPTAAAPAQAPAAAAPAGAPAPAMSDEQIKRFFEPGSYEEIPHDNMRKTIARRLAASMQTTPHFYLTVDCNLDALLALREQLNAAAPKDKDGKPGFKLSVNDFMIKAHALALMRVPAANVSWTEGSLLRHKHVDIGVAVAIPDGLITPIVRKADIMSLSAISNAMKDFGARAKNRKLKPDEYQGGSTALSNLGMFGIKEFTAIINPPHSTILAVGAGEKRVVVKNDQPAVATIMSATLSCDHRAIDGALGAQVIAAFKQLVENPMTMLV
jgi:pyruvate dehydrogenase E2 component (dihydrolipoamide acetyltransferase)